MKKIETDPIPPIDAHRYPIHPREPEFSKEILFALRGAVAEIVKDSCTQPQEYLDKSQVQQDGE